MQVEFLIKKNNMNQLIEKYRISCMCNSVNVENNRIIVYELFINFILVQQKTF